MSLESVGEAASLAGRSRALRILCAPGLRSIVVKQLVAQLAVFVVVAYCLCLLASFVRRATQDFWGNTDGFGGSNFHKSKAFFSSSNSAPK